MASRLFDSGAAAQQAAGGKQSRESIKQRAAEIDKLLKDELELDQATSALGSKLAESAEAMGITAIRYKEYRERGSKWMIEHTRDGADYIYQMFPLRPLTADWRDTIILLIAAMDSVFPRSVQIKYMPPNEKYQIKYFTIRLVKAATLPGWEDACGRRGLSALAAVAAWS